MKKEQNQTSSRNHQAQPFHEETEHSHGFVDPSIMRSKEGINAVSLSLAVLIIASLAQAGLYGVSHSVALLADVIHNAGDALTAIPLGLAFFLHSKKGEKWAGYCIVFVILISAFLALYQVINKFMHPQTPTHLLAIVIAGIIGVIGNELAAIIRWRAGQRLHSPALIADGNHARTDGLVSFGVIVGAGFIKFGWPMADPIIGLVITGLILHSSWESWQMLQES